jgi:hypothetical protein
VTGWILTTFDPMDASHVSTGIDVRICSQTKE